MAAGGVDLPRSIPRWRLVIDKAGITVAVFNHQYPGSGTESDPYVVSWIPQDPRDPQEFTQFTKWFFTAVAAISTLAVALLSSAYSGGVQQIMAQFGIGTEVATLGVSLFVLGFAIGPFLWAPLSELFGRQILFTGTYFAMTMFCVGATVANNVETLLICRFFAGAFGSSPLTNSGGIIADMFPASQRGLAMALFASAPFLGPAIGPIAGGFLGQEAGWRWVLGFLATFGGVVWIGGTLLMPETYAPVLLRARADKLSKLTGKCYMSAPDKAAGGKPSLSESFKVALSRPWQLLFLEPIVLLLSLYMSVIYGTLYMLFGAFPIVFQQHRGWSEGVGGLAFLGIVIGMVIAIACTWPFNALYNKAAAKNGGRATPEDRLPPVILASVAIPAGIFWFAWTNSPSIHWAVSIAATIPFGFGMVLCFLGIMNYLIDSYAIFAASVLAASSLIRSLFGAAFPLFTTQMYDNLGIHWASSVPGFLALACVPFPFLFYKYGAAIRARCKYAAEAESFMQSMMQKQAATNDNDENTAPSTGMEDRDNATDSGRDLEETDPTSNEKSGEHQATSNRARANSRRRQSMASIASYEGNPYNIDRVNTRDSFV